MMDKTYVDETFRGHCETTANTSHGAHIPWTQHHIPNVCGQNIHGQNENNNAPFKSKCPIHCLESRKRWKPLVYDLVPITHILQ